MLDPDSPGGQAAIERRLVQKYTRAKGRAPRLSPPVSFNEHILHRIIHDRDPRLKIVCDKLAVRDFIRQRVGARFVVPLLGAWSSAAEITWGSLPWRFFMKPSHASGLGFVVCPSTPGGRPADEILNGWLAHDHFERTLEWGYLGIPRRILAEPLLAGHRGGPPLEVQVQVVKGKTLMIGLITGTRGAPDRYGDWFHADGRRPDNRRREPLRHGPLPAFVRETIVPLAEFIARDFIQMRVDVYVTSDGLKIGELTPYHSTGLADFDPPELDEELGRLWTSTELLGL